MNTSVIRAAICTRFGTPSDVIEVQDVAALRPEPGFVRVRMLAAPINPSDLLYCSGTYSLSATPPMRVGWEGVGVVEESGGGVLGWLRKGKRVSLVSRAGGTWGTECVTQSETVFPIPDSLSVEQGAAYFINPASALLLTRWVLQIPRGSWLIQSAANSAVGRMVIRLGNHFGFRTCNLVRKHEHVETLKKLGASAVLVVDESTDQEEFRNQLRAACGGTIPRVAIDPIGGPVGGLILNSLSSGGKMISYGSLSRLPIPADPRSMLTNNLKLEGFLLGEAISALSLPQKVLMISQLEKLHRRGLFQVETFEAYPLDELKTALTAATETPGARKIILKLA